MTAFAIGPILCLVVFALLFLGAMAAAAFGIAHAVRREAQPASGSLRWRWFPLAAGLSAGILATVLMLGLVGFKARSQSYQAEFQSAQEMHFHETGTSFAPVDSRPPVVAPPTFAMRTTLIVWPVIFLMVVVLVSFVVGHQVSRSRRSVESSREDSFRPSPRGMGILTSAAIVLAGLVLLGWTRTTVEIVPHNVVVEEISTPGLVRLDTQSDSQLRRLPAEDPLAANLVRLADDPADAISAIDAGRDPLPQDDRTTVNEPTPDWLATGRHFFDGEELQVIASQQFATEAEARHDANTIVAELLTKDLAQFTRAPLRPRRSPVTGTDVHRAVREEYVQSVQRDFGTFFAPMYRVWYKVELSPAVREPYLVGWRAQLVESRTLTVVSGFAALLLAPLGVLFAAAARRATGGAGREWIDLSALFGVLALWSVGAWVLNQYVVLWN